MNFRLLELWVPLHKAVHTHCVRLQWEHDGPLDRVTFPIHSLSPSHGEPLPPAPEPAPKGKHVQLFEMRRKVGHGFYLVPVNQNASKSDPRVVHEEKCFEG